MNLVSITEEVENTAIVGAHSIDQFAPEIESIASTGLVTVERNTMLSSVKKSAGSVIVLGMTLYDTAKEMKQDRATGNEIQKAAKQTSNFFEQFLRDLLIDILLEVKSASLGFNNALVHSACDARDETRTRVRHQIRPTCAPSPKTWSRNVRFEFLGP